MRPPRGVTCLFFAAVLTQLVGCQSFHPVPLRSIPGTREGAQATDELKVVYRNGTQSPYRSQVKVSGAWIESDTLRGIAQGPLQEQPIRIPIQDIVRIGHTRFSLLGGDEIPENLIFISTMIGLSLVIPTFLFGF